MRLICSLTGCDWGETRVERETDDRGDEVVVTEVEFQLCERCGSRRTVGENKEVRSKTSDDEEHADDQGRADDEPPEVDYEEPEETEDAVFVDDADDGAGEAMAAAPGRTATSTEGSGGVDRDGGYRCPDCGFVSDDESLREGDVCPDCGSGYLEEA